MDLHHNVHPHSFTFLLWSKGLQFTLQHPGFLPLMTALAVTLSLKESTTHHPQQNGGHRTKV